MTPSTPYGNATATRNYHYIGLGWYHRTVALPPNCTAEGLAPWLVVDAGMHRRARAYVRASSSSSSTSPSLHAGAWAMLFNHTGYLDEAEARVPLGVVAAALAHGGATIELAIGVDATVHPSTDPLMGAADDDTDGTNLGGWGGLNSHVSIECRSPAWIAGVPHVTHEPVTAAKHEGAAVAVSVAVNVTGDAGAAGGGRVSVDVADASGAVVASCAAPVQEHRNGVVTVNCSVPHATLWDPESPTLYTARVSLQASGAEDAVETRFGIRTVTRDGPRFLMNGRPLFLTGYGDDAVYPLTVAPPRVKLEYTKKLTFAHSHGFRFVRHHSHVLPDEYFDASDEVGVLISPELPCVYHAYYDKAGPVGLAEYARTWAAYIKRLRNHPSIFDWAMCNEYASGIKQGPELYATAKELDPTRLVIDCDGLFGWSPTDPEYLRPTLDFASVQFDVKSLPLTKPDKFLFNGTPQRPVISHETGNYNTFPRVERLLTRFAAANSSILPYWLTPARDRLAAAGLLGENELWANCSEKLYRECWKLNIEAIRKNVLMSGYEWWLLVDYWGGNNGLTDTFEEPKSISESIAGFHGNVVVLQDGLEVAYTSGGAFNVAVSVSNFGLADIPAGASLKWTVASSLGNVTGSLRLPSPAAVGSVTHVGNVTARLHDVGTTRDANPTPVSLVLRIELEAPGTAAAVAPVSNGWTSALLPTFVDGPSPPEWNVTLESMALAQYCMFDDCAVIPDGQPPSNMTQGRVHLTTSIQDRYLQIAEAGGVVVFVPNGTDSFFPVDRTTFKQAWWVGSPTDNNAGSVVYPSAAKVFGDELTRSGWADWTWWRMIDGALTFILDDFGPEERANTDVLVRAIDIVTLSRNKALLIQMRVGKGWIVGVGLDVLQYCPRTKAGGADCPMPEKAWAADRLLRYAGSLLSSS